MPDLPSYLKILDQIDKKTAQTFTELVESEELNLSRNTVTKYLKYLRENNLLSVRYEGRKIINLITPEGKLELETALGKDKLTHRIRAYQLFDKKIKTYRDEFLKRFGPIENNSILIDCIENFLNFMSYNFDSRFPSEDFQYILAYFIARYDIQYCKSENWLRTQSSVIQLTQERFYKKFKVDPIQIQYFSKEWSNFKFTLQIIDKKDRLWFLSSNSYFYEMIMEQIHLRTRRGLLQEIIFNNFIFIPSIETIRILDDCLNGLRLVLDFDQKIQLQNFIRRMINIYLDKRRGYPSPWLNLPNDPESLLKYSVELETELNKNKLDLARKLEILRTLLEINNKLKHYTEVIYWGQKYLELKPDDVDVLTILALHCFNLKKYSEFLEWKRKLKQELRYDMILNPLTIKYYVEIEKDLQIALELIEETEKFILDNDTLQKIYPKILYYKAKVYKLKNNLDFALLNAEKAWSQYDDREIELYKIIVDLYKELRDWEQLEDFCLNAHYEDEYNIDFIPDLYYAHLKRNSFKKAEHLYEMVKRQFPDILSHLNEIKKEFEL